MAEGSYGNDPANSDLDAVRFMIDDREAPFRLSDQEVEFLISRHSSSEYAAAEAAEVIGGQFSTKADKTVGPLSIKYSQQASSYFQLANALRTRAGGVGGGPVLTQTSRPPLFGIGMHDNGPRRFE